MQACFEIEIIMHHSNDNKGNKKETNLNRPCLCMSRKWCDHVFVDMPGGKQILSTPLLTSYPTYVLEINILACGVAVVHDKVILERK